MLTEQDVHRIAVAAAEEVLARRPVPSAVTLKQAAELLDISPNAARNLKLRRNAVGPIPHEAVLAARAQVIALPRSHFACQTDTRE